MLDLLKGVVGLLIISGLTFAFSYTVDRVEKKWRRRNRNTVREALYTHLENMVLDRLNKGSNR